MKKEYKITDVYIHHNFELEQIFCSCGVALDSCKPDCPNYGKKWDDKPELTIKLTLECDGKQSMLEIVAKDYTQVWKKI